MASRISSPVRSPQVRYYLQRSLFLRRQRPCAESRRRDHYRAEARSATLLDQNKVSIKLSNQEVPGWQRGSSAWWRGVIDGAATSFRPSSGQRLSLSSLRTSWSVGEPPSRCSPCVLPSQR